MFAEIELLENPETSKMKAKMTCYGARITKLGARHPITTPTTQVTNHSNWPDHMIGLVGRWRRVEKDGTKEWVENEKAARLLEERWRKKTAS